MCVQILGRALPAGTLLGSSRWALPNPASNGLHPAGPQYVLQECSEILQGRGPCWANTKNYCLGFFFCALFPLAICWPKRIHNKFGYSCLRRASSILYHNDRVSKIYFWSQELLSNVWSKLDWLISILPIRRRLSGSGRSHELHIKWPTFDSRVLWTLKKFRAFVLAYYVHLLSVRGAEGRHR